MPPFTDHSATSAAPSRADAYPSIAAHGLIGDLRAAALVANDGTIDWLCVPRFDSPSVFAALLDTEKGGAWRLLPTSGPWSSRQYYLPASNILVTRFMSEAGVVEVVDYMPVGSEDSEPPRALMRKIVAVRGTTELRSEVRPRFDYGRRSATPTQTREGEEVIFEAGDVRLRLRATVAMQTRGDAALAAFSLNEGEAAAFSLDLEPSASAGDALEMEDVLETFAATVAFWREWVQQGTYRGRWREMVERSALTLKLLTHRPTGAIIAAPTTSLPEHLGGTRNWDYRYVWSRDAAFSAYALIRLGYRNEAGAFVGWLADCMRNAGEQDTGPLAVLYDLDGRRAIPEQELEHLEGYRGSKPVRVGNAADGQLQLDIYGEVMDSVYLYDKYGQPVSSDTWEHLKRIVEWVCEHWDREDEGIWETRGGRQKHTFSHLMCWVAIERAIRIARRRGLPADLMRWTAERDAIYYQIMDQGFNTDRGAFVQHYGSDALDASLLLMPMLKFISPTDPKFLSTLDAIESDLVSDSLVYRYDPALSPDGLDGNEGTLSICSFWYVEALTRTGRLDEARLALEKMFTYANHLGLYAEQIGLAGEQLGNFPQAFTHLALISAAVNLDRALDKGAQNGSVARSRQTQSREHHAGALGPVSLADR